MSTGV